MKFRVTADPNVESYEIEVTGLIPGTEAQMAISATNSAGTSSQTCVPIKVAAPVLSTPSSPVIEPVDSTAQVNGAN